ncbi:MAG: TrkH family potassium uptake protein [Haloarculaceae archaeon]
MSLRVDWRSTASFVGTVVKWLSVTLLVPLVVALYYGEGLGTFVLTMALAVGLGVGLERLADADERDLGHREGFLFVALTWLVVSLVGGLPYLIAGQGTISMPVNALFESMSGFTTTGATIMGTISPEVHSRALLIWRQETQWLGGMGIVVLAVAILPELSVGGAQLVDAEAPGPGLQKLSPRIAKTARVLWGAYFGFTVLQIALLYAIHLAGLAPEMTFYNAVAHAFTTMPTGGFSPAARSIEAFSAAVQWVIVPFMVVAGTNFALFWHTLTGDYDALRRDTEFLAYLGILGALSALLTLILFASPDLVAVGGSAAEAVEPAIRHAAFQVVSIVTTTGYASVDFNAWSEPAQYVLFVAMFVGASAGSTGGAIKVIRWVVIGKSLVRELFTTVHPTAVRPIRLGGRALDERTVEGIYGFTLLYLLLFGVSAPLLLIDAGRAGLSLSAFEVLSATASCLGNVGPAFGAFGPMENYESLPRTSKLLLTFLMWAGRLEVFPVLVLLTRSYWRS